MIWNIKKTPARRKFFLKKKYPELLATVLANRVSLETANAIMEAPETLIESPYELPNAEKCAQEIVKYLGKDVEFQVFADYDVDGLTSGFVMSDFLCSIGETALVYYPQRTEGYGLNMKFCSDTFKRNKEKKQVVITVDNGIAALKEVTFLNGMKVPVIVTDHHEPKANLPHCVFCDPWAEPNGHGLHLAGVGVAYKICQIIQDITGKGNIKEYLPYVAMGTIADVMPMTPENIALVLEGLKVLNHDHLISMDALAKQIGLKAITAKDIAWEIAPVLNAAGRMGDIELAADLLFAGDMTEANDSAIDLIKLNDKRKKETKKATEAAKKELNENDNIVLFDASGYEPGIAGVIAGKICEMAGRPAIVYSDNGNEIVSGSCRSIPGFDVLPLLGRARDAELLDSFGGHAQACGVNLISEKIEDFRTFMNKEINKAIEEGCIDVQEESIDIDKEITFNDLKKSVYDALRSLPYDKDKFTEPVFIVENVNVKASEPYSNKEHLVLDCVDKNGTKITLVSWNNKKMYDSIGRPDKIDIVGTITDVGFSDKTTGRRANDITLNIIDVRAAQ